MPLTVFTLRVIIAFMKVVFRTRQLERCFLEERAAAQTWGPVIGRRYIARVLLLQGAARFDDLFTLVSLRLHALRGGRAGQYAMTL